MMDNEENNGYNTVFSEKDFIIIVIEDDFGLNHLIRKKLRREGFIVESAHTGNEALEKVKGDENEVLLLDYNLPDYTGRQLIEKIIERLEKVPCFIMMTGFGDEKIAVDIMKLGARDYIVKEADFLEIFTEKVKKVCHELYNSNKLYVTEAALKKNTELLNETGKIASAGGWELNLNDESIIWTDTTRQIHEVGEEYLPTLNSELHFFPGKYANSFKDAINKARNNGMPFDIQTPFVSGRGRKLWVRVIGKPTFQNGECVNLHGIFQDITGYISSQEKIKAAYQQLEASEQQLRATIEKLKLQEQEFKTLFEGVDDIIYVSDPKTYEIIHVNDTGKKYLGKKVIGKICYEALYCLTEPCQFCSNNNISIEIPGKTYVWERHNEKNDHWFKCTDKLIHWPDGRLVRFQKLTDITSLKKYEKELQDALEKAKESDRLKSAFLANMSHEIRTPMNGMLGFIDFITTTDLNESEREEYKEIIFKCSQRLLNTINDLIDISKIEAGQVKIKKEDFEFNKLLREIYNFFIPEARSKGLEIKLEITFPDKDSIINTDREKLYAVLSNLVKNAIKFTREGCISIGYYLKLIESKPLIYFYVEDTGVGIPKNRQQAIFNRFEQADIEDKRVFEGSGLGLSIAKAYIELLGGNIEVESEEGLGSKFTFSIEYKTSNGVGPAIGNIVIPNEKIPEINNNYTFLIVEDDNISLSYLKRIFNDQKINIITAQNGKEAVEICKKEKDIDLILMDIKMPEMDGYLATKEIRKFNKDVIIIAQTAFALAGDREKALNAGCNDYLAKPIKKDELKVKLHEILKA